MLVTRVTSLLALLLAVLGLSALPAGALAQDEPIDEEIELVEDDMWCDDEIVTEDDFADEDETELRQVEEENPDEFFDEEDPDFLGPGEDDFDDEEPSDDDLVDDCDEELENELEDVSDVVETDTTRLVKKGKLTATLFVPGRAVIDSVLTQGGTTARAARRTVLGKAHQKVRKAGDVTVRIKLTPKGRKVVRKAKQKLRLTLTTQIKLASGRKVVRVTRIRP